MIIQMTIIAIIAERDYLQVPTGLGKTTPAVYTAYDDTDDQSVAKYVEI